MPLESGTPLGPYEVISPVGAGGMGEVYKAKDPRLNRTVAIKVLPPHIAERPEFRERFEREAKAIASFNHPHICVVHDVGRQDGIDFLVMEYLEGETLADRIRKGALPFDQLLTYAIQIADALDKAHRHGVTHRDLKPGNVMITRAGVKLLDFGLAKVHEPGGPMGAQSMAPTVATAAAPLTAEGTILGTLQYMAPEQLEGKEADARSDIFAFGSVLYEMATGRRAFEGKSQVSLMAAILEHDPPPVSALQALSPARFDDVVRICLAKNPDERWQSAADLAHELKLLVRYGSLPVAASKGASRRERLAWATAACVAVIAAVFGFWALSDRTEPAKASFEVQADAGGASGPFMFALSPDGRHLVARVQGQGIFRLWLRPIERVTGVTLPGTEGAFGPFWSPDGRYIGFVADGKLKTIDVFGAPPQTLADAPNTQGGGAWNRDGVILFAPQLNGGPLFRIGASGGQSVQVTELDTSRGETAHRLPRFLPDGVHFLYLVMSSKPEFSGIHIGSLDSKETRRLVASDTKPEFAPPDLLLFLRESTLMAQRFDASRLELSGDPFQVADGVGSNVNTGAAGLTVSDNGVLAYRKGSAGGGRHLAWFARTGDIEGAVGTPALYENPRLSPDGRRLAVFKPDRGGDIWIADLERGTDTRFTFDPAADNVPVWSPDGTHIAFVSNRKGGVFNLYVKSSNGTGDDQVLLETPNNKTINDWSADGRYILYEEEDPKTKTDLWVLPLFGDRKPVRVLSTPFVEARGSFSPDGAWIAYESDENGGRQQVYVQGFPESKGKWQISTGVVGASPRWRPDGKELFYDGGGPLMAVDLNGTVPGGAFKADTPQELFTALVGGQTHNLDISPDGRRFLLVTTQNQTTGSMPIVVVLNWTSGIAR